MIKAVFVALSAAGLILPLALIPDLLAYLGLDWLFSDVLHRRIPGWLLWPALIAVAPGPFYYAGRLVAAVFKVERDLASAGL